MTTPPHNIIRLAVVALLVWVAPLSAQRHTPERSGRGLTAATAIPAARRSALAWLRLLDQRDYSAAFVAAAPQFQERTTLPLFSDEMDTAREKFRPFGARKIITQQFFHDPEGGNPGDYVILKFHTDVVDDGRVSETLTMERMADGKWRVTSYFISLKW